MNFVVKQMQSFENPQFETRDTRHATIWGNSFYYVAKFEIGQNKKKKSGSLVDGQIRVSNSVSVMKMVINKALASHL